MENGFLDFTTLVKFYFLPYILPKIGSISSETKHVEQGWTFGQKLDFVILCAFTFCLVKMGDLNDSFVKINVYDETFGNDDEYVGSSIQKLQTSKNDIFSVLNVTMTMKFVNPNLSVITLKVYDRDRI